MDKTTPNSVDVPTVLPGFEDDDARERLLLENASDELENASDEESIEGEESSHKPHKRRSKVLKTFAGFAIFLCLLIVGIAWFFGMGWFSSAKTQVVNRSNQKDATASPVTEDEKLKMALSMVAPPSPAPATAGHPDSVVPVDITQSGVPAGKGDVDGIPQKSVPAPIGGKESYSLPLTEGNPTSKQNPSSPSSSVSAENGTRSASLSKLSDSDDVRGRSLFFGMPRNPSVKEEKEKSQESQRETQKPTLTPISLRTEIPFGTMLPVRLIGSIYTLRSSGGFVRMELTRSVEGKGYSYPAGTMIVGNVRGGESVRAFVNIVGLIDPISGELFRFSGELLGADGASGIEGKRRSLTSQWSRFFRSVKDTAASFLGSVGTFRSGGTVILSEPIRRSSESMTEELSGALLKNDREDTFLEVAAGSNGYVLVTGLPENSTATSRELKQEAAKE